MSLGQILLMDRR